MMRFCATEIRSDGQQYGVDFNAPSWAEADRICIENGWTLDGELHYIIPASADFGHKEADELVSVLNEAEAATKQ